MRRTSFVRTALAGAGLAGLAAGLCAVDSHANGRPPATTNIQFQPGEVEKFFLPVTFGLLRSTDGGGSFRWVCETAIGYGGTFDPDYSVTAEGDIYATTFEGLRVSTDGGCTWTTVGGELTEEMFVSEVEVGPDGRVWATTSTGGGPNNVFVSTDGNTFTGSNLPEEKAWWTSLRTTAADPMRIYVTGFLPDDATTDPAATLRRSLDGGATWEVLPVTDFVFGDQPQLYLLATSPTDADVVFARAVAAVEPIGDAIYRSADGGQTWQLVVEFDDTISAFHIRPDGETVIAATINGCPGDRDPTAKGCVLISRKGGAAKSWVAAAEQPRLACLGERSDGVLFGCGANWEPDNFALGRSEDGETWEKVYRFSETAGPLECEGDTEQAECAALVWPSLCVMFGICEAIDAGVSGADAGPPDGEKKSDGGCSWVTVGGDAGWVPGLLAVLFFLGWRSRSRR